MIEAPEAPAGSRRDAPRQPIGVLAIQGSFDLHAAALERAGIPARKVRRPEDLEGLLGIILPGGESTVLAGVSRDTGLFPRLRAAIAGGLPAFGTCAGAILLGQGESRPERLGLAPVTVVRNAYGRQAQSFEAELLLLPFERPFRGIFIRAPRIELPENAAEQELEVLGWRDRDPVLVRHRRILLATFHPELTSDLRLHRYFESLCRGPAPAANRI
jgi:5'-phosphate synthase pdxT subunit